MKLTDKIVAALTLKPGETERLIADDDMTGLRLRLRRGAKGVTKRWVYKYSRGARQHSFTLDWPAHNLTAARKHAGELQAKLRLGQDPAKERRAGKAEALATMGAVLLAYLQQQARGGAAGQLPRAGAPPDDALRTAAPLPVDGDHPGHGGGAERGNR